MPDDVAVFSVERSAGSLVIDPIVVVHYGSDQQFKTIPALNDPSTFRAFDKTFYISQRKVTVFRGGEKLGGASVKRIDLENEPDGCSVHSAEASYNGPLTPLLASSADAGIPGHPDKRRAGSAVEVETLRRLAIEWLRDYGLDRQLIEQGRMGPVISTPLRTGHGPALIGRFDVRSKLAIHRLFAIAEEDGGGYALTLAGFSVQRDLEDGKDRDESEHIDQLDIDNDGADEVVTKSLGYEGWTYTIWKYYPKGKQWSVAYTGGGAGC